MLNMVQPLTYDTAVCILLLFMYDALGTDCTSTNRHLVLKCCLHAIYTYIKLMRLQQLHTCNTLMLLHGSLLGCSKLC